MAVVLDIMHTERCTLATSPPGTTVGGWLLMPTLKAVGHQSTNWRGWGVVGGGVGLVVSPVSKRCIGDLPTAAVIANLRTPSHPSPRTWMVRFDLIVTMDALTSFGTTSPRYMRQHAMYLPWRGSHFTIMFAGSNTPFVISATDSDSWYAFSAGMMGAYDASGKWMRGYGTRFVWNSVRSTFSCPSKRSDAVMDDTHCASKRFRFVYVGRSMSRLRRQMSYSACAW